MARKGNTVDPIKFLLIILAVIVSLTAAAISSAAEPEEPCEEWVFKVVSLQGTVQARKTETTQWLPVRLNQSFCPGVMIRVLENSRAAILLPNEALLRLD